MLDQAATDDCECDLVLIMLDYSATKFKGAFAQNSADFMAWQEDLVSQTVAQYRSTQAVLASREFQALLQTIHHARRLLVNMVEFWNTLSLVHGSRCLSLMIREALGRVVVRASEVSKKIHRVDMALALDSSYANRAESGSMMVQLGPPWGIVALVKELCDAVQRLRWVIHHNNRDEEVRAVNEPHMQDKTGGFSEGNFAWRALVDGWHLDHGLVASLLRLWPPNKGARRGIPTTVVDFGGGGGHYCKWFNKTGHISCRSFDGSRFAPVYTDGAVQTLLLDEPIDLGRTFDWVMCIEVAEHIPRKYEATFLHNLRRHAREGLILSWSMHGTEGEGIHPNARPWHEVLEVMEKHHFRHDEVASADIHTRISWLRNAVHVFRTTWPDAEGRTSPWQQR